MLNIATGKYIILLLIFIVLAVLQIFLSKKKDRLLGLVLPIITFLYSLLVAYRRMWIYQEHKMYYEGSYLKESIGSTTLLFIMVNIPTIIFILIYILSRQKINRNKELEKMNIQDLD